MKAPIAIIPEREYSLGWDELEPHLKFTATEEALLLEQFRRLYIGPWAESVYQHARKYCIDFE